MNPCHVMDYLMMICHCLAQLEMGGQWQLIISSGFCLHVFGVSVLIHVECVCVCVCVCVTVCVCFNACLLFRPRTRNKANLNSVGLSLAASGSCLGHNCVYY